MFLVEAPTQIEKYSLRITFTTHVLGNIWQSRVGLVHINNVVLLGMILEGCAFWVSNLPTNISNKLLLGDAHFQRVSACFEKTVN